MMVTIRDIHILMPQYDHKKKNLMNNAFSNHNHNFNFTGPTSKKMESSGPSVTGVDSSVSARLEAKRRKRTIA